MMQHMSTTTETFNHCENCGLDFFYRPELHECADSRQPLANPYAGMSWVEECMAKQHAAGRVTRRG